jgi:cobyric acid synthase
MNPVLLKPTSEGSSQVVVPGQPIDAIDIATDMRAVAGDTERGGVFAHRGKISLRAGPS